MTLRVTLVVPEGEIWSGNAERMVAKTLDGEIGILTGHTPVLGVLAHGSVVRILPEGEGATGWISAAVGGGFLSVSDDRVSVLARQAVLGEDVDRAAARADLEAAIGAQSASGQGQDNDEVGYLRALLRAAGEEA